MVTTRSGKNTSKQNTKTVSNSNTRGTRSSSRNTRCTRTMRITRSSKNSSRNTKSNPKCVSNNVNYSIINNRHRNINQTNYDYIYRTVNINDMSDFHKITKYGEQYPSMMYVVRNNNKSQVAYGTCETRSVEDTFAISSQPISTFLRVSLSGRFKKAIADKPSSMLFRLCTPSTSEHLPEVTLTYSKCLPPLSKIFVPIGQFSQSLSSS